MEIKTSLSLIERFLWFGSSIGEKIQRVLFKRRISKINERPIFTDKMTIDEFDLHYWYKLELQDICRQDGLLANGTKAELEQSIRAFLSGDIQMKEYKRQESANLLFQKIRFRCKQN